MGSGFVQKGDRFYNSTGNVVCFQLGYGCSCLNTCFGILLVLLSFKIFRSKYAPFATCKHYGSFDYIEAEIDSATASVISSIVFQFKFYKPACSRAGIDSSRN